MPSITKLLKLCSALFLASVLGFAQSSTAPIATAVEISDSSLAGVPGSGEASSPSAIPAAPNSHHGQPRPFGVGLRFSTLGIGGEIAAGLTRRTNLRGGFNAFGFSRSLSKDGVNYAGQLTLRSAEAHFDWFPLGNGIRLSPGVMAYNGNKLSGSASVPGNQSFTLSGVSYRSDPSNPVTGSGSLEFNKVAPTATIGTGNLVRRRGRRFGVNFDVGVAFSGSPRTTLNLAGGVCDPTGSFCRPISSDPTVQANVAAQKAKFDHDISPFKVYPIVSFGFSYRFR